MNAKGKVKLFRPPGTQSKIYKPLEVVVSEQWDASYAEVNGTTKGKGKGKPFRPPGRKRKSSKTLEVIEAKVQTGGTKARADKRKDGASAEEVLTGYSRSLVEFDTLKINTSPNELEDNSLLTYEGGSSRSGGSVGTGITSQGLMTQDARLERIERSFVGLCDGMECGKVNDVDDDNTHQVREVDIVALAIDTIDEQMQVRFDDDTLENDSIISEGASLDLTLDENSIGGYSLDDDDFTAGSGSIASDNEVAKSTAIKDTLQEATCEKDAVEKEPTDEDDIDHNLFLLVIEDDDFLSQEGSEVAITLASPEFKRTGESLDKHGMLKKPGVSVDKETDGPHNAQSVDDTLGPVQENKSDGISHVPTVEKEQGLKSTSEESDPPLKLLTEQRIDGDVQTLTWDQDDPSITEKYESDADKYEPDSKQIEDDAWLDEIEKTTTANHVAVAPGFEYTLSLLKKHNIDPEDDLGVGTALEYTLSLLQKHNISYSGRSFAELSNTPSVKKETSAETAQDSELVPSVERVPNSGENDLLAAPVQDEALESTHNVAHAHIEEDAQEYPSIERVLGQQESCKTIIAPGEDESLEQTKDVAHAQVEDDVQEFPSIERVLSSRNARSDELTESHLEGSDTTLEAHTSVKPVGRASDEHENGSLDAKQSLDSDLFSDVPVSDNLLQLSPRRARFVRLAERTEDREKRNSAVSPIKTLSVMNESVEVSEELPGTERTLAFHEDDGNDAVPEPTETSEGRDIACLDEIPGIEYTLSSHEQFDVPTGEAVAVNTIGIEAGESEDGHLLPFLKTRSGHVKEIVSAIEMQERYTPTSDVNRKRRKNPLALWRKSKNADEAEPAAVDEIVPVIDEAGIGESEAVVTQVTSHIEDPVHMEAETACEEEESKNKNPSEFAPEEEEDLPASEDSQSSLFGWADSSRSVIDMIVVHSDMKVNRSFTDSNAPAVSCQNDQGFFLETPSRESPVDPLYERDAQKKKGPFWKRNRTPHTGGVETSLMDDTIKLSDDIGLIEVSVGEATSEFVVINVGAPHDSTKLDPSTLLITEDVDPDAPTRKSTRSFWKRSRRSAATIGAVETDEIPAGLDWTTGNTVKTVETAPGAVETRIDHEADELLQDVPRTPERTERESSVMSYDSPTRVEAFPIIAEKEVWDDVEEFIDKAPSDALEQIKDAGDGRPARGRSRSDHSASQQSLGKSLPTRRSLSLGRRGRVESAGERTSGSATTQKVSNRLFPFFNRRDRSSGSDLTEDTEANSEPRSKRKKTFISVRRKGRNKCTYDQMDDDCDEEATAESFGQAFCTDPCTSLYRISVITTDPDS